ncbi:MAG: chorismate synthase [Bacteroidota bacterium]|jgi:chorismate synthase
MAGNTLGKLFRITTFGESHGAGIGVVIDGCPAGLTIDEAFIQKQLSRRKPGQSAITTSRSEDEQFEILSGVFEGKSTGAPIAIFIRNKDTKPEDYLHLKDVYRPNHADFTYEEKYGIRDYRGSGRASARETVARVLGGSVAQLLLNHHQISIQAFVSSVGKISMEQNIESIDLSLIDSNIVRCPDAVSAKQIEEYILSIKEAGDSVGGCITCVIKGVPVGLGEPVFDKLHADLAKAMMSINAVKGFEIGDGFSSTLRKGSEHNDLFISSDKGIKTASNNSGGIQGGISNGATIYFRVAFKPVSTIMQEQQSVDKNGNAVALAGKGRHDPCVVPRAVPIVESMAALVIADHLLRNKNSKIN